MTFRQNVAYIPFLFLVITIINIMGWIVIGLNYDYYSSLISIVCLGGATAFYSYLHSELILGDRRRLLSIVDCILSFILLFILALFFQGILIVESEYTIVKLLISSIVFGALFFFVRKRHSKSIIF